MVRAPCHLFSIWVSISKYLALFDDLPLTDPKSTTLPVHRSYHGSSSGLSPSHHDFCGVVTPWWNGNSKTLSAAITLAAPRSNMIAVEFNNLSEYHITSLAMRFSFGYCGQKNISQSLSTALQLLTAGVRLRHQRSCGLRSDH